MATSKPMAGSHTEIKYWFSNEKGWKKWTRIFLYNGRDFYTDILINLFRMWSLYSLLFLSYYTCHFCYP